MSKEKRITFETAKLAKEKGFKINTKYYFDNSTECVFCGENKSDLLFESKFDNPNIYARPTQSELKTWLRTKHQIYLEVQTDCTTAPKFCFEINKFMGNPRNLAEREWCWYFHKEYEWFLYREYEEAFEEGLKESLRII